MVKFLIRFTDFFASILYRAEQISIKSEYEEPEFPSVLCSVYPNLDYAKNLEKLELTQSKKSTKAKRQKAKEKFQNTTSISRKKNTYSRAKPQAQ